MELFAMVFAVLMVAAALAATILVGGVWAALAMVAILVLALRALARSQGDGAVMSRDQLNAFQRPLADD